MFDDFDLYESCEEYFGEDYNLWEEEQCFLDWCYEQEDAWLDGSYEE